MISQTASSLFSFSSSRKLIQFEFPMWILLEKQKRYFLLHKDWSLWFGKMFLNVARKYQKSFLLSHTKKREEFTSNHKNFIFTPFFGQNLKFSSRGLKFKLKIIAEKKVNNNWKLVNVSEREEKANWLIMLSKQNFSICQFGMMWGVSEWKGKKFN